MVDGVVVDASVIARFYPELVEQEGPLYELIICLAIKFGFATNGPILAEWQSVCNTPLLHDWITDELKNGRIRMVNSTLPESIRRKIRIDYGLPRNSRDIQHIRCANGTTMKYILSEDIDHYDPKLKGGNSRDIRRAREMRRGRLCVYLRKELGIRLGTTSHCHGDLL